MLSQILGDPHTPLPWEGMCSEDRKKLGAFRGPIMKLLNRSAEERPTMMEFYDSCRSIFSSSATIAPDITIDRGAKQT